jgi:hypothetical protein
MSDYWAKQPKERLLSAQGETPAAAVRALLDQEVRP